MPAPFILGAGAAGGSQISSAFLEHSARILTVLVGRRGVSGGCPSQFHDSRFQVKFQVVGFPDPRFRSSRLSGSQVQVPRAFLTGGRRLEAGGRGLETGGRKLEAGVGRLRWSRLRFFKWWRRDWEECRESVEC